MKTKIGKRQVDNGEDSIRYAPFEDWFQFASMLVIRYPLPLKKSDYDFLNVNKLGSRKAMV